MSYDDHGRLDEVTRPSGKTISSTFDSAGRLTDVAASDGTAIEQRYEAVTNGKGGRLDEVETAEGAVTGYERNGSVLKKVTQTNDTWTGDATGPAPDVSYGVDSALRPTSQTIDGDTITATYNDDDQVTAVGPVQAAYDAATGDMETLTVGETETTQTLNGRGELTELTTTADVSGTPTTVLSENVVRDYMGRITQRTVTDDSGTNVYAYAYDVMGRLTEVKRNGSVIESYSYDSSGGLVSRNFGLLAVAITTDGHGRPTAAADGATYTWSDDGEMLTATSSAGTSSFEYDGFGRVVKVTLPDGKIGRYRYNAEGRRTAIRLDGALVRRFVYGDSEFAQARIDADGDVLERYVYGSQAHVPDVIVRRDGQRIRLVLDATASVRAAVDADTGTVLQRLSYDAYGRVTQDTNPGLQPFGFKGALTDPVAEGAGLVWMGVRAYQPRLARFTTPDPAGLAAGWNQHDALAGDPINKIDADGRFAFLVAPILRTVAMAVMRELIETAIMWALEECTGISLPGGIPGKGRGAGRGNGIGGGGGSKGSGSKRSGEPKRVYEGNDEKHRKEPYMRDGEEISRAPRGDCQAMLDCSTPVPGKEKRRQGVEPSTGKTVEFKRHQEADDSIGRPEAWHGYVPEDSKKKRR